MGYYETMKKGEIMAAPWEPGLSSEGTRYANLFGVCVSSDAKVEPGPQGPEKCVDDPMGYVAADAHTSCSDVDALGGSWPCDSLDPDFNGVQNIYVYELCPRSCGRCGSDEKNAAGWFQLVLAKDPTQGIRWGTRNEINDEWNLYSYSVVVGPASEAGNFSFAPDGLHLTYQDDPFLGIEYSCGSLTVGNVVVLLRARDGMSGRNFERNEDGSLSPVDAPDLVLGVSTVTRNCEQVKPEHEHDIGLTLVPFGSEDRVLMAQPQGKGTDDKGDAGDLALPTDLTLACTGGPCSSPPYAEGCLCGDLSEAGEACGYHSTMGADCSNCHNCANGWIMGTGYIGSSGTCSATCSSPDSVWAACGLPPPPPDSVTKMACGAGNSVGSGSADPTPIPTADKTCSRGAALMAYRKAAGGEEEAAGKCSWALSKFVYDYGVANGCRYLHVPHYLCAKLKN
jgi:hypothetical protein